MTPEQADEIVTLRQRVSDLEAELERAHQSANERSVREKALYDECVRLKAEIERLEREIFRLRNDVEP